MTIRTKVLAGDVDLAFSAVMRQLRLDFGAAPVVLSDSVIHAAAASDHRHYKTIWGSADSVSGAMMRLACSSPWAGGNNWWASLTEDGDDWSYEAVTATTETPADYTRPGIYLTAWDDTDATGAAWYISGSSLHMRTFTYTPSTSTLAWGGLTTRALGNTFDAATAIALSATACMVIGVEGGKLWAQYHTTSTSGAVTVLWSSASLEQQDAFMCDAALLSGNTHCLAVNLADHGAAHAVLYDSVRDTFSAPMAIAGGGPDDPAMRLFPVGLSLINGRLWLTTWRAIEGSEGLPYAYHLVISSSADGVYWRDDGFVGEHTCFGRLLYESGDSYAYLVGNAAIYRAVPTSLLGGDPAGMKRDVTEAVSWRLQTPKAGGASVVSSNWLTATGGGLDTSPLFVPDNQLEVILSSSGESDVTLFTGYLSRQQRDKGYPAIDTYVDQYQVSAVGPIARLSGDLAYQPPGGIMYNSPTAWYSDFNGDGNSARLSVAGLKGAWNVELLSDQDTYTLKGIPDTTAGYGLSTVPRAIHRPSLSATLRFKGMVEIEGVFLVLLYEDEDNYWRVGLYDVPDPPETGIRLEIQRVKNGILDPKEFAAFSPSVDTWYSMHVNLTPGQIKVWLVAGEVLDFSAATTCAYDLTDEIDGLPVTWHAGVCVLDRANDDDAIVSGTVTKSYPRYVWDESKDFDNTVLGKFLRVNGEWRRIVDFLIVQDDDGDNVCLTVDPALAEAPPVGSSYGVYATEGEPYVLVRDLSLCDCAPAWTIDDLASSIMELSGVARTINYADTLAAIGSASQYRDLAVTITGDADPSIILYASGQSSYTGWVITVEDTQTILEYVFEGGAPATRRKIPHVVPIDVSDQPEIRIIVSDDSAYLYSDRQFLGCLADIGTPRGGYVGKGGTGTYTVQEFGEMRDMFAWASNEKPNQCLSRLLRGRHAKLRELGDGSVELSRFDTRTDLGAWDAIVSRQGPRLEPSPSIIGMVGAEYLGFYIDPNLARKAYRFRRTENPTAETQLETVNEARLTTKLARETAEGLTVHLYALDPDARIEDVVSIDSVDYIIDAVAITFQVTDQQLTHQASAQLRKKIDDPTPGVWGTDNWGQTYYG